MGFGDRNFAVIVLCISAIACTLSCRQVAEIPVHAQSPLKTERKIIITADDFGASRSINEGIMLAAEYGSITTISAFTNFGNAIPALQEISKLYPDLGIGVHLNLNTGKPVSDPALIPSLVNEKGEFFTIEDFVVKLKDISIDEVRTEMKAQVDVLLEAGIRLDHISSHFGVFSLHRPYFKIRNQLALEYGVAVRSPVSAGQQYPEVYSKPTNQKVVRKISRKLTFRSPTTASTLKKQVKLDEMRRKSNDLDSIGIKHPDIMIDCFYGSPSPSNLIRILENLPQGTSELIVHLGSFSRQENYPPGLDTLYLRQRECELMTISSPYVEDYLNSLKIVKSSYGKIGK